MPVGHYLVGASRETRLPRPPIFIVGVGRSGNTWLHEMISAHPRVGGVFESWMLTRSNGFAPLLAGHWGDDGLRSTEWAMGHSRGLAQLVARDEVVDAVRRLADDWLSRALGPGEDQVVEKGPLEYEVAAELFPEARFIHILRDGRDVAASMEAASGSWAPEMAPHLGRRPLTGAAAVWAREVAAVREFAPRLGDRFHEVRYEQLRAHPAATMRRVFGFCGLELEDAELDRIVEDHAFALKKAADTSGFIRQGKAGSWSERLGPLDRLLCERRAGRMLRATGYEMGRFWWLRRRG